MLYVFKNICTTDIEREKAFQTQIHKIWSSAQTHLCDPCLIPIVYHNIQDYQHDIYLKSLSICYPKAQFMNYALCAKLHSNDCSKCNLQEQVSHVISRHTVY